MRDGMLQLLTDYCREAVVLRAVAEAAVHDPSIGQAYTSAVGDYARAIERFVRRGRKEGWIAADVVPADTADALALEDRVHGQPGRRKRHGPARREAAATLAWIVAVSLLRSAGSDDAELATAAP